MVMAMLIWVLKLLNELVTAGIEIPCIVTGFYKRAEVGLVVDNSYRDYSYALKTKLGSFEETIKKISTAHISFHT